MTRAYIAFGGNLDDVPACFRSARRHVAQLSDTRVLQSSLLYRTPPLGPPGQPDYHNAVIAIDTGLAALALLDALQRIEHVHDRVRAERWGPRTLDLDIIAINGVSCDSPQLTLPHPEMQRRQFVLRPLCDIAPNWQHPRLNATAAMLLQMLLQRGETPLAEGVKW